MYGGAAGGSSAAAGAGIASRSPSITISKLTSSKVKFTLSGTDSSMANSLRRVMMAEVPTLAVDTISIIENSSVMHDEFVAHRLGLIPIRWKRNDKLPREMFPFPDECDCDFSESDICPKCSIEIHLNKSNNTDPGEGIEVAVTSHDLVIVNKELADYVEIAHFLDGAESSLCSADKGIMIDKLGSGQRLELIAVAKLGIGKQHAKHNPTATVCMRYEPDIRLNRDLLERLSSKEKRDFVARTQPGVFRYDEGTDQVLLVNPRKAWNIDEIRKVGMAVAKAKDSSENLVSVGFLPDRFIFSVETSGALPPEMIVTSALRSLIGKLTMLQSECRSFPGVSMEGTY